MFGFDTADDRISELCAAFFDLTSSKNEPIVRSLSIALLVTSREFFNPCGESGQQVVYFILNKKNLRSEANISVLSKIEMTNQFSFSPQWFIILKCLFNVLVSKRAQSNGEKHSRRAYSDICRLRHRANS